MKNRLLAPWILALLLIPAATNPSRAQPDEWPRSVLITNDDGIDYPGLHTLARAFAPIARTYVVAPMENKSGSTNYMLALSNRYLVVERRELGDGIEAFAVDGFPGDAVALALGGLLDEPPDLVISGMNGGPNLGTVASLSGTVGAARTAALLGTPAIAVSGFSQELPETAAATATWVVELARSDLVRRLEPGAYVTVSVPRVPLEGIRGVRLARRAERDWRLRFVPTQEATGPARYELRFEALDVTAAAGTDIAVYEQGYLAVVPMSVDESDDDALDSAAAAPEYLPPWTVRQR